MTKSEAIRRARRDVSTVYKTAGDPQNGSTWGFSVRTPAGTRVNDIGSYRDAVAARAEMVREWAGHLREEWWRS